MTAQLMACMNDTKAATSEGSPASHPLAAVAIGGHALASGIDNQAAMSSAGHEITMFFADSIQGRRVRLRSPLFQ